MSDFAPFILIGIGLTIRLWSCLTLRSNFTPHLCCPGNIIRRGPYRWIRHPSYIGSIFIFTGLILLIRIELVLLFFVFVFFYARAVQEDSILSQHRDFQQYRKETGLFLPRFKKEK